MGEQKEPTISPFTLFYSYAHEDELLRNELEKHLSLLRREGLISEWYDRQILAGEEWAGDINEHLEMASIILLLISPDFLASDYCYNVEMQRALDLHRRGVARVVPIILRPADWHNAPFASLQCLPRDGKPVTTWQNQDEVFQVIAQDLRRVIARQHSPTHPAPQLSSLERRIRPRLLKRVRSIWIEGVLEHSLHQAVLIALDLKKRPDVLDNPFHLVVQETDLPPHLLPARTSIVEVYDEAEGGLLILGEPGAGKTTLLLQIARTLLERAEEREQEPLPVVFNLSSRAQKREFTDWLVDELENKYQVPRDVGDAWIKTDQVLPLLDGLDEVAENERPTCVREINTYYRQRMERGSAPLVVCCRDQEYKVLSTRIALQQAVSIQPLTDEQIEDYLQSAGGQLGALRQALQDDALLYELVHRPLMLSIFTLAYQRAAFRDLPTKETLETKFQRAFDAYVERMLTRRSVSKHFPRERMLQWLTFLAVEMKKHHQTAFYPNDLQPDWLADRQKRPLYQLFGGLLGALIFGFLGVQGGELLGALIFGFLGLQGGWLFGALAGGLVGGLVFGEVVKFPTHQLDEQLNLKPYKIFWLLIGEILRALYAGLLAGLLIGLVVGLVVGLVGARSGLIVGLIGGVFGGLLIGLFFGLAYQLGAFPQHFTLRFWLWRTGCLPWKLVTFLDQATERILLRKVGSGYTFVHSLLLDYFASLSQSSVLPVSTLPDGLSLAASALSPKHANTAVPTSSQAIPNSASSQLDFIQFTP